MNSYLRALYRYFTSLNAKDLASLAGIVALVLIIAMMLVFGPQFFSAESGARLTEIMAGVSDSPVAVFAVIVIFSLMAMAAAPQFLLIAVTVIVFGPILGAIYAWIGTMCSASLTFWLGHVLGGDWVKRMSGGSKGDTEKAGRFKRSIDFVSAHGVMASALVRVVPSGPFIVINATAGAAQIPYWKFGLGTGLGIIPKIALITVIACLVPEAANVDDGVDGVFAFFNARKVFNLTLLGGIILLWLVFLVGARFFYRRLAEK